jgi:hypothetical protein
LRIASPTKTAKSANDNGDSRSSALLGPAKINSSDPHLMSVWTPYPTPPLLARFYPVVEIACYGLGG